MFEEEVKTALPSSLPATPEPAKATRSSLISIVSSSSSSSFSSSTSSEELEDKDDDATPLISNKRRVTFSKSPPTIITMASPAYIQVSDRVAEIVERFSRKRGICSSMTPTLIDYGELLTDGRIQEESFIDRVSSIIDIALKVVPMPKEQVPAQALQMKNSAREEAMDLYLELKPLIYGENGSSGDTHSTGEGSSLSESPQHSTTSETLIREIAEDGDDEDVETVVIVGMPHQQHLPMVGTEAENSIEKTVDGGDACPSAIQESPQRPTNGAPGTSDGEAAAAGISAPFSLNTTMPPVATDGDDSHAIVISDNTALSEATNHDGDVDTVEYSPQLLEVSCCIIS